MLLERVNPLNITQIFELITKNTLSPP